MQLLDELEQRYYCYKDNEIYVDEAAARKQPSTTAWQLKEVAVILLGCAILVFLLDGFFTGFIDSFLLSVPFILVAAYLYWISVSHRKSERNKSE